MKALLSVIKKSKKQFLVYLLVPVIIGLISSATNDFSLVSFIDTVFLIGIFCVIFSGFVYLYEKGFFAIISYSFRKVVLAFSRGKYQDYDNDNDKKSTLEDYLITQKYPFTKPLLYASILLVVFTFTLSFAFYS